MYMDILSKENETAKLLDEVRKYPASVFAYGKQLSVEFLQEVCDICVAEIYKQADEAKDRKKYKKVCSNIKSLFDYGSVFEAEAILADLVAKYPRRTAFVDELKSLSQKFDKAKNKAGAKKAWVLTGLLLNSWATHRGQKLAHKDIRVIYL